MYLLEILKTQSTFEPRVEGGKHFVPWDPQKLTLIAGMGGSRLAGGLLSNLEGKCAVQMFSGFDLPKSTFRDRLPVIVSSASGDVPETLSNFDTACQEQLPVAVVGRGGRLMQRAIEHDAPRVAYPDIGVPPRESVVHSLLGHLSIFGMTEEIAAVRHAVGTLDSNAIDTISSEICNAVRGKQVILYGPDSLEGLMRVWKINLNETARVPAFISLLPEALHGEIAAFDGSESTNLLSSNVVVLFITTPDIDIRMRHRIDVLRQTLSDFRIQETVLSLPTSSWEGTVFGIASSMVVAHQLRDEQGISRDGANLIATFKSKTINS